MPSSASPPRRSATATPTPRGPVRAQAERHGNAYPWVSGLRLSIPGRLPAAGRLLQQADAFAGLTHLELSGLTPSEFARLVSSPAVGLLTHLCVNGIADEGVTAL